MKPREIFLAALRRQAVPCAAAGSATSVITTDLMDQAGVWFPEAHLDAGKMAALADHCTRDLCSPTAYRDFLLELHHELHERISCPIVLHICGNTADRLIYLRETGLECFHFDSKVPAVQARTLAGQKLSLMGGTSNFTVVRNGTTADIAQDVQEKLAAGIDIIGPECAVPLDAPWMNLQTLAEEAKLQSAAESPSYV